MKTDRFLGLANWGFNVPIFICNANKHYGRDTYLAMKKIFGHKKRMDALFCKEGKKNVTISDVPLDTAVLDTNKYEGNGYSSILMEHVCFEFSGMVTFYSSYGGRFYFFDPVEGVESYEFMEFEDLDSNQHRHIVRVLHRIKEKLGDVCVNVDFRWAKDFVGVNGSRLVVYDYEIL